MVDDSEPPATQVTAEPLSLDERKFKLDEQKFEFEKTKTKGLGLINSNFGIIITAIIGVGTIIVSYVQLQISKQSASAQFALEQEKAKNEKAKDDRAFQFDLARLLLDKANDLNTDDERRIPYLRAILATMLPPDLGLSLIKRMADNASTERVRSRWNDVYVDLRLSVAAPSAGPANFAITVDYVVSKFPQLNAEGKRKRLTDLLSVAQEKKLGDDNIIAIFLAAIFSEVGLFDTLVDNFNYSAEEISRMWPSRLKTPDDAKQFANNPQLLANQVYAGRMGNKDPDDGWRFRGRGYLMLTGREAYREASAVIGVDLVNNPDLLLDSQNAAREAVHEFIYTGALPFAAKGDMRGVMFHLNGGFIGLSQAQAYYQKLAPETPNVTEGLRIEAQGGDAGRTSLPSSP